jgi:hypothetical protein
MSTYTPSDDHRQPISWREGGTHVTVHEDQYHQYGPPPPNYNAVRKKTNFTDRTNVHTIQYQDLSSANARTSYDHPFSPAALAANGVPIVHDEPTLDRPDYPGVFQVPFTYKTDPRLRWGRASSWQDALATTFATLKVTRNGKLVTESDIKAFHKSITPDKAKSREYSVLYHPADRKSMVFKDEPVLSMTAAHFGFSLILICPFTSHNGHGYNRLYNTRERPPIYARWSTGSQGLLPPLVLGCLTKQFSIGKAGSKEFEVMWSSFKVHNLDTPGWWSDIYASS